MSKQYAKVLTNDWEMYQNGFAMNIIPKNDFQPHTFGDACKCKPKVEFHRNCLIISHNSYDKREFIERLIHDCWNFLN